ncbi:MAG: hypothetical protein JXQ76_07160, partial [Campylobacterales bacterium]|nr:hypothetical protein [Campylobacterales bacterium]
LSSEARYVNGKKEGVSKNFYPDGSIRINSEYKNDNEVFAEYFKKDGSLRLHFDKRKDENIVAFKFYNEDNELAHDALIQHNPNDKKKATVTFNEKDYTAHYTEYDYEPISAAQITFKDDPNRKEGELIEYDKEGNIKSYAKVKDGYLDGESYSIYNNSKYVMNYSDGKINGMRKEYNDGILTKEIEYKDNQKNGISREYYDDGTLKKEAMYEKDALTGEMIEYREDGSIKLKLVFNDQKGGKVELYDRNKNLIRAAQLSNFAFLNDDSNKSYRDTLKLFYPNNKPYMDFNLSKGDGRLTIYYPTGELKYTINIKNYQAQGEAKKFYKNGKLRALIPFSKGKIEGTIRIYYPNAKSLKYTLPYKKNKLSGTKIKYDHQQKTDYNLTYRDGVLDLSKPFKFKHDKCSTIIYYENKKIEHNISCVKETKIIKGYYQNGMLEYEISYKKDQKEGLSYLYYGNREFDEVAYLDELTYEPILENNTHQELKFANDKLNGQSKFYNKKGELVKVIEYKDALKEGTTTLYGFTKYGNKPTTTKTEYKNDKKDGNELYYEEGELKRETQYKQGKKDGKEMQKNWKGGETLTYYKNDKKNGFETQYNKDGSAVDGKEYRDGEIVYEVEEVTNEQ